MKLYGYTKAAAAGEEPKLRELQEVMVSVTPEELRRLAAFFLHSAAEIEAQGVAFEHAHFVDFRRTHNAEADIIVFNAAVE